MAINKVFIVILLSLCFVRVLSQSLEKESVVTLNTLEGNIVKVTIGLDNVNDKIILKLNSSEPLCISGYRDLVEDIQIINETFIFLHYRIPRGSASGCA